MLYAVSLLFFVSNAYGEQRKSVTFSTEKLSMIANRLALSGLDTLKNNTSYRDSYYYKKKKLNIRKDLRDEISHIGFSIFHPLVASTDNNVLICDFVERYALEYSIADNEARRHLQSEDVVFEKGNMQTLLRMDGLENVTISRRDMRTWRIVWRDSVRTLLAIRVPMSVQLIYGCNLVELEKRFIRNVTSYTADNAPVPIADIESFTVGETFIIDAIRSQTFQKDGTLIWNGKEWRKSLYNLVVSGQKMGDYKLNLTFDLYGYNTETAELPFEQWIQYCRSEGCKIYLGIKEIREGKVKATVFAPNHSLGYCHMLSISMDMDCIGGNKGAIYGRMYLYTPLHNLPDNFFENEYM